MKLLFLCLLILQVADGVSAVTYYVDFSSGSDAANGTSTSTPWKHCPGDANATGAAGAAVLSAGDVVNFKQGTTYTGTITLTRNGSSGSPIVLDGLPSWGTGGRSVIQNNTNIANAFIVQGQYTTLQNLEISGTTNNLVWVDGGDFCTVSNCSIHDSWLLPYDVAKSIGNGIYTRNATDLLIVNNQIFNICYITINLSGGPMTNVTIRGNTLHDGQCDAINGTSYGNYLIENNYMYHYTNSAAHSDGIQILDWYSDAPLIIRNNTIIDAGQSIFLEPYAVPAGTGTPSGIVYVYNNICASSDPGTNGLLGVTFAGLNFDLYKGVDSAFIFNNVFSDINTASGGVNVSTRTNSAVVTNFWMFNNLFYNSFTAVDGATCISNINTGYNLFTNYWRNGQVVKASGANLGTLSNFYTLYPNQESNSIQTAVLVLNYSAQDFHPVLGYAGINVGFDESAVFTTDKDGNTRPAGAWDIGAYEYVPPQFTAGTVRAGRIVRAP